MKKVLNEKGFTFMEFIVIVLVFGTLLYFAAPHIKKLIEKTRFNSFERNLERLVTQGETYHKMKELKNEMKSDVLFDLKDPKSFEELDIKKKAFMTGFLKVKQNGEVLIMASNANFCGYKVEKDVTVTYDLSKCTEENYVDSIEDLVRMSNEAANGETNADEFFYLIKDLDFNDDSSYENPSSVEFGDFNQDGVVNTIKEEVTTSTGFYPVNIFSGALYGLGYSIKNLYINRNERDQALIRYTYNGKFKDMTITGNVKAVNGALLDALSVNSKFNNITVNGSLNVTGIGSGLLFTVSQGSEVEKITANGTIRGTHEAETIGGVGGNAYSTKFKDITTRVDIVGSKYVGGVVGGGYFTNMDNIKTGGTINKASNGAIYLGGIVGFLSHGSSLNNAYSSMSINGDNYTGGIAGVMSIDDKKQIMPIIMNSGFTGTLTNNVYGGGSIVGAAVGKIYNCFSKGNLIFPSSTTGGNGGLVGVLGLDDYDQSSIILENSYFAGNINSSSSREVGTLVGKLGSNKDSNKYTLIKNSYSIANLNGNNVGLIGISFMNGENLFNGGQITGYSNSGNIVGNLGPNTTFNNVHSITQKGYITNKMGSQISSVKSSYLRENVKLGNGFKYDSESYPLLYKRNSDGSYSDELLENQGKINLK